MTSNTDKAALLSEMTKTIRRWAKTMAREAGGSVGAEDLVQVGLEAALKAAETFDPEGGAGFRTYCWHPVSVAMRREAWVSRGSMGCATRVVGRDVSLSAPAHEEDGDGATKQDLVADDGASVEETIAQAQKEATVRRILAQVRAEQANGGLFDDLLERLMTSHFGGDGLRLRSEVSCEEIAAKHGCSKQNVNQHEKKLRAVLVQALAGVEC